MNEENKTTKKPRGFAALPPEQRTEMARRGGKRAHELGKARTFTREEAKVAGRLGGLASKAKKLVP
jgi:uncharacterized protein